MSSRLKPFTYTGTLSLVKSCRGNGGFIMDPGETSIRGTTSELGSVGD